MLCVYALLQYADVDVFAVLDDMFVKAPYIEDSEESDDYYGIDKRKATMGISRFSNF
jgi:hypothetical protein